MVAAGPGREGRHVSRGLPYPGQRQRQEHAATTAIPDALGARCACAARSVPPHRIPIISHAVGSGWVHAQPFYQPPACLPAA